MIKILLILQWLPLFGMLFVGICFFRGYNNNVIDGNEVAYGNEPSYGYASTMYQLFWFMIFIFMLGLLNAGAI